MIASAGSLAIRAIAVTAAALALAWFAGGQALLGRIDPALLLPLLPLVLLPFAWVQRSAAARSRWQGFALAIISLVAAQALLAAWLGGRVPWSQLFLVAAAAGPTALFADRLAVWQQSRGLRIALALLLAAGWFAGGHMLLARLYRAAPATGAPATMLTGLPLRWASGGDLAAMISRGANDDPVLVRLEAGGPLRLVDSIVDDPPPAGGTLLLAHPRALAPQELVAIDMFVRNGGKAVILADALSGWPAPYPLGDARNPPITSLLTPLFDHWGVTLDAALTDEPTAVAVDVGGSRLRLSNAGRFGRLPAGCDRFADARIARCPIGTGLVWLVGDADLLYAPLWQPVPIWAAHLRPADTIEWLTARLWPDAPHAPLQPLWIRARPD